MSSISRSAATWLTIRDIPLAHAARFSRVKSRADTGECRLNVAGISREMKVDISGESARARARSNPRIPTWPFGISSIDALLRCPSNQAYLIERFPVNNFPTTLDDPDRLARDLEISIPPFKICNSWCVASGHVYEARDLTATVIDIRNCAEKQMFFILYLSFLSLSLCRRSMLCLLSRWSTMAVGIPFITFFFLVDVRSCSDEAERGWSIGFRSFRGSTGFFVVSDETGRWLLKNRQDATMIRRGWREEEEKKCMQQPVYCRHQ